MSNTHVSESFSIICGLQTFKEEEEEEEGKKLRMKKNWVNSWMKDGE